MADTIAAIATARGRGGIGVVRVSGEDLRSLISGVLGRMPPARVATLSNFFGEAEEVIDQGIALFFPAPHSFTGEDVLELQGHGGDVVLHRLLNRCLQLGARLSAPGEFTRRAFLNDKMDLAQAEGVADLIDAETTEAAKGAMRSLRGDFSRAIHDLVDALVTLRMLVEASLDFPDEEIDFLNQADAAGQLDSIRARLARVFASARQGSLLREGMQVILIGQPNVGKSSLLNRLAGEEVAIVTPFAGTTRDAIRQHIEIDGVAVHVVDTAGLRETQDEVEQMGIARTWAAVSQADIALLLLDMAHGMTPEDQAILARLPPTLPVIRVCNKIDLQAAAPKVVGEGTEIHLSAKTGEGVDLLRQALLQKVGRERSGEGVFLARARHMKALREAGDCLADAGENLARLEILAEDLRLAQEALASITGEFTPEDLLGEIFSRFCIGK